MRDNSENPDNSELAELPETAASEPLFTGGADTDDDGDFLNLERVDTSDDNEDATEPHDAPESEPNLADQLDGAVDALFVVNEERGTLEERLIYKATQLGPETTRAIADELAGMYREREGRVSTYEAMRVYANHIGQNDDADAQRIAADVLERIAELEPLANELVPQVEDLSNRRLNELRETLVPAVDWARVVDAYARTGQYGNLPDAIRYVGNTNPDMADYNEVLSAIAGAEQLAATVAEHDHVRSATTPGIPEGYEPNPEIVADIHKWRTLNDAALRYLGRERIDFMDPVVPELDLERCAELARNAGLDAPNGDTEAVHPAIVYAIESHLSRTVTTFDQRDKRFIERTQPVLPTNEVSAVNGQAVEDRLPVEDVQSWQQQRLDRHPPHLRAGLTGVTYDTAAPKTLTTPEGDTVLEMGGTPRRGGSVVVNLEPGALSQGNIDRAEREGGEPLPGGEAELDEVQRLLDHEVAHRAHLNAVPLATLRLYETIRAAEPYAPSIADNASVQLEDWASSVELFLNSPWTLLTDMRLTQRFGFFNEEYDVRYTPEMLAAAARLRAPDGGPASAYDRNKALSDMADNAPKSWAS